MVEAVPPRPGRTGPEPTVLPGYDLGKRMRLRMSMIVVSPIDNAAAGRGRTTIRPIMGLDLSVVAATVAA